VSFTNIIDRPAASALIPMEQSREIIKLIADGSAALQLARRAPNMAAHQRQIPVLSVLPMAYFVAGDGGLKATTASGWEGLMLTAEEIACIVPVHQSVFDDAAYPLWEEIRPDIASAIGRTFDNAAFFGVNKPASWPEGVEAGARAAGNVVTRGTNDAATGGVSGDLSDLYSKIEDVGYEVSGLLLNGAYRGILRQARNTQGEQLDELVGGSVYGFEPTYALRGLWPKGAAVTEGFAGDFTQMIVAIRQDISYTIADQGVISDEAGLVKLNLLQQDSIALRVVFRAALQVAQPVTPEVADKAARYPFAVIEGAQTAGAAAAADAQADAETAETSGEEHAARRRR
jgi:HK97 family phage major capsid protein